MLLAIQGSLISGRLTGNGRIEAFGPNSANFPMGDNPGVNRIRNPWAFAGINPEDRVQVDLNEPYKSS
jgi:hypothetical protein